MVDRNYRLCQEDGPLTLEEIKACLGYAELTMEQRHDYEVCMLMMEVKPAPTGNGWWWIISRSHILLAKVPQLSGHTRIDHDVLHPIRKGSHV